MGAESKDTDPFKLTRFIDAQKGSYQAARSELQRGRKSGHWMWYIFPQMLGLGQSITSQTFGISCMAEARAFASHFILGPRLMDCTRLVLDIEGRPIEKIFSYPDHMKFFSSMTLFAQLDPPKNADFVRALSKFFSGRRDQATIRLLGEAEPTGKRFLQ